MTETAGRTHGRPTGRQAGRATGAVFRVGPVKNPTFYRREANALAREMARKSRLTYSNASSSGTGGVPLDLATPPENCSHAHALSTVPPPAAALTMHCDSRDVHHAERNPGVGGVEMVGCKHEQRAPHTCPFAEEINNDSRLCACCAACESNCADDI